MGDVLKQQIILTTGPLGGLGDHFIYTTLPERYTQLGFDVYLDQDNLARNGEQHELLWSKNPYILGTSDKKPNAGYINQGKYYDIANRFPIGSIEAMERAHGLLPPYSLAPKIYYEPQPFKTDLSNAVLGDFSAISSKIGQQGLNDFVNKMNERFQGKQFYQVRHHDTVGRNETSIEGLQIGIGSIYEYVDALASCYAWIGSEAGCQALAAAVRGEHDVYDMAAHPELVCLIMPKTYNSRGYTFRGVDYRVTTYGMYTGDYWEPVEAPYERYALMARHTVEEHRKQWEAAREK